MKNTYILQNIFQNMVSFIHTVFNGCFWAYTISWDQNKWRNSNLPLSVLKPTISTLHSPWSKHGFFHLPLIVHDFLFFCYLSAPLLRFCAQASPFETIAPCFTKCVIFQISHFLGLLHALFVVYFSYIILIGFDF